MEINPVVSKVRKGLTGTYYNGVNFEEKLQNALMKQSTLTGVRDRP